MLLLLYMIIKIIGDIAENWYIAWLLEISLTYSVLDVGPNVFPVDSAYLVVQCVENFFCVRRLLIYWPTCIFLPDAEMVQQISFNVIATVDGTMTAGRGKLPKMDHVRMIVLFRQV